MTARTRKCVLLSFLDDVTAVVIGPREMEIGGLYVWSVLVSFILRVGGLDGRCIDDWYAQSAVSRRDIRGAVGCFWRFRVSVECYGRWSTSVWRPVGCYDYCSLLTVSP